MHVTFCRIFLLFSLFVLSSCWQKETKRIPVSNFFKTPEKSFFRISPNGQYISYLRSYNDRQNICIQSLKTGKEQCVTSFSDVGVRDYFWSYNNDIVFSRDIRGDGDQYNLSAIKLTDRKIVPIISLDSVRGQLLFRDQLHPDWIVIGLNKRDPSSIDVYRLNVRTAELKLYITNPGNITEWYPDWAGNIRLAKESDGVNETILYRSGDTEPFKPIIKNNFKNSVMPLVFTDKKDSFYALSNVNRDKAAVVVIDGRTGKEEQFVYGNKDVDISNATASRLKKQLLYVGWDDDRPRKHFLSPQIKTVFDKLSLTFPEANIRILDRDSEEDHLILSAASDRNPGTYFLYDTNTGNLRKLADLNIALDSANLCRMKAVSYKASDGLNIPGFLTLPKTGPQKNLPLVVLPHSTPWNRNTWGYNDEVQFLANRGYAVFQPNFRGSKGYGKQFHQAGFKQMGGKMQQDILDGVNWLIKEGIADKEHIGIYGGGFGGFSALYGVARYPDRYRCAIVSYGLINFFTYLKDVPPYYKPQLSMMYEMVGNPEKDAVLFKDISPVFYTYKIHKPLLIFQGAKDPSASLNEINHFVSELRRQNVPVNYVLKENERRFFRSERNKIDQYTRIENFLETNLKAKR